MTAKYYEAYDLRYKQIHQQHLQWASDTPSPIVGEVLDRYPLPEGAKILEIGCGEGRDALELLRRVGELLQANGFLIENIDSTIIAQWPKLSPYRQQMRENIAKTLGIEVDQVNVKATTEEGLGFTGAKEGISAQAIALLSTVADYNREDRLAFRGCGGCAGECQAL